MQYFFAVLLALLCSCSYTQGYKIEIKLKGAENQKIYLGTYFGNKKLVVDSVILDAGGQGLFSGENKLEHGLYLIILPERTYFDIIVSDDQDFSISNNIDNITEFFNSSGSDENLFFSDFQKFTYNSHLKLQELTAGLSEKEALTIRDSINNIVRNKRKEYISKHKGSFFSELLYAMEEPEMPENINELSEEQAFQYYKQNYFSHINFNDERLIRSPIVFNKINHFFMHLCEWYPDSVTKYAFYLLDKSSNNKDFFYYVFVHLYNELSVTGKFSCDEAYVAMLKKFINSEQLWWADENFKTGMKMQIKLLEPTLTGITSPSLSLFDIHNKPFNISEIKADWILLFFWDPDCQHCSSFYQKLNSVANKPEYSSIVFITVNTASEMDKWKAYIEKNTAPFIHTIADPKKPEQLDPWNLFATPRIFVLDKEMKIVLKDPDPDYIPLFLNKLKAK